jgi:two-component system response regulator PilR (NtrC family)
MSDNTAKILVVEDEKNMREVLSMLLEEEGYEVRVAADGQEGFGCIDSDIFDIIITDIKMPGATGFEVLKRAKDVAPDTMVIMITAFGTIESGIEAMKLGAYDYINKPFKIDEIRLIVRNALDKRKLKAEVTLLRETVKSSFEVQNIIGRSAPMQKVLKVIPKIAQSGSNVLISGESGTGKELVAAALHNLSPWADNNFVAINCASLPEGLLESEIFGHMRGAFTGAVQNKLGLFELARDGSLFLDEIGEMPINLQSKLLRAIEYGTFRRVGGTEDINVKTRIISATNRNLEEAIVQGVFREDLFYRLNVIPIRIPPLRERPDDIPVLMEHFIQKYSPGEPRQFSGSAMNLIMNNEWVGNIRELENMVERVLLLTETDIITDNDIPDELKRKPIAVANGLDLTDGIDLEDELAQIEQRYLTKALESTEGNKTAAAKLLGLSFRSFRHKLSKYGIKGL